MAQDVCSKMAEDPFVLKEDGYLNAATEIKKIVYHPSLNVILICINSGIVRVLDVNSGVVLQASYLSTQDACEITCLYIPGQDRVLFCDGYSIGVRSNYNGVLLLDTILQKPINNPNDNVKLELLLSEAIILKQSLSSVGVLGVDHVLNELTEKILDAQKQSKKGIKAQKWNTVCLNLPFDTLRTAVNCTVTESIGKKQHSPELGVASAVYERLSELVGEQANASDRRTMASEAKRRETFTQWPHMDYKWALPDQMAQAGFYHLPNESGDDRAMCFTCSVCLVCWERTDEPWSEHERHSPSCPFVMGEYTQNIPISVTYATNPAIDATYRGVSVQTIGTSSVSNLIATANKEGLISVFDVSGKLRRTHSFFVTQFDSHILDKLTQDFGVPGTWSDIDEVKCPAEKQITALTIVGEKCHTKGSSNGIRPTIICGLSIKSHSSSKNSQHKSSFVETLNDQNKNDQSSINIMEIDELPHSSEMCSLYLVVYDFQYTKESIETKKDAVLKGGEISNKRNDNTTPEEYKEYISYTMLDDPDSTVNDTNMVDVASSHSDDLMFLSDVEMKAYTILKQQMSMYQNLIPGESDEIFLPPSIGPTKQPSVRLVPDTSEADLAQAVTILHLPPDYSFMNGQLSSSPIETTAINEKSISDHIAELKNSKVTNKLNYSRAEQCISLPKQYKNRRDLEVSHIVPTPDGGHIFVVLGSTLRTQNSVLLVYSLNFSCKMVKINEEPLLVRDLNSFEKPIEVTLLPHLERLNVSIDFNHESCPCEGNAVLVCQDGCVRIIDLSTLKTISIARLEGAKFISAVYCNSLERLCASTDSGSLHFYALNDVDNDSIEDQEDEDVFSSSMEQSPKVQLSDISDVNENSRYFYEPVQTINISDLKHLQTLCEFEPLKVGYCAVVPPCWSEMQQAQRQRRHPHLQVNSEQHTKMFRLQTDTTTWDEHIFELTLPSPTCIGHVDVHFSLHSSSASPHVEITLLKQNTYSIGHKRDFKFSVDDSVTCDSLQWVDNPVTSHEYLQSQNVDILAGPVDIVSCLDLTEQSGCVTLTSPKLFKSCIRTLLLHIKSVCSKENGKSKLPNLKCKRSENRTASVTVDKYSQTGSHKTEFYMGCDCLHEVSITIHSTKHTDIPHERNQRASMLESNIFVQSLCLTATLQLSIEQQNIALDILIWVASIRLTRNRSNNGQAPNQQLEFLKTIEINLMSLLRYCLLFANRSMAHKCVKLMILCSNGAKDVGEQVGKHFDLSVLNVLMNILDSVDQVNSAASLQWLINLLLKVTQPDQMASVALKCISLLGSISHELNKRTNPYHLLLRSRYGLFGTPLEPELFDIEPPPPIKPSSIAVTYATVVTGENTTPQLDFHTNYAFNKEALDPKEVLSVTKGDGKIKLKNIAPSKLVRGLLETEPLHFTCASASEGTRIERADVNGGSSFLNNLIPITVSGPQTQTSGTKKVEGEHHFSDFAEVYHNHMGKNTGNGQGSSNNSYTSLMDGAYQVIFQTDNVKTEDFPKLIADTLEISVDSDSGSMNSEPQSKSAFIADKILSPNQSLPWQQLLVAPPQQVIVVERMHSGARRFVTLDFGQPVLLTDVLIPACHDLVSISLDLWIKSEDVDATRLVTASDISTRNLVFNDLQPPPLCRFIKITAVGRYGMTTTRCRIPVGYFYGHLIVLPEEISFDQIHSPLAITTDLDNQLNVLSMLLEDVNCRYSLACSKLKDLLHPFLTSGVTNASHLSAYMNIMKESVTNTTNCENSKVFAAYQEAITYQRQLNTVRNVMRRIENGLNNSEATVESLSDVCVDKLRCIVESLLDALLSVDTTSVINLESCHKLFQGLCVSQGSRIQFLAATVLVRSCGKQPYWGTFLAETLREMYSSSYNAKFPQDRVFVLLAFLGRKSLERSSVLDATLKVIAQVLLPLAHNRQSLLAVSIDLPLLGWLLLFLSLQLDISKVSLQNATRWDWVTGEMAGKSTENMGSYKKKIQKRVLYYKQQMQNLDWTHKVVQSSTQVQALASLSTQAASLTSKVEAALKQHQEHSYKKSKPFKSYNKDSTKNVSTIESNDIAKQGKRRRETNESMNSKQSSLVTTQYLDSVHCLAVAKGLLALLLAMDHSCSADMFLLSCKVIGRLVCISKLQLGQLMNEEQLLKLIHICMGSELPWAPHALACLLQDIVEVGKPPNSEVEMETDASPASTSWGAKDLEILCDSFALEDNVLSEPATKQGKTISNNNNNNHLPSVFESDDSELEDFLDDILERSKSHAKKSSRNFHPTFASSCAMDSRLEMGVEALAEITLRRLVSINSYNLMQNVNATQSYVENEQELPPWPSNLVIPWNVDVQATVPNRTMLVSCFNSLFKELQLQSSINIEHILQLWLTLNCVHCDDKFDPSAYPFIGLDPDAVNSLITTVAWSSGLSLRTWCSALQTLTMVCNMLQPGNNSSTNASQWTDSLGLYAPTLCIINHPDFVQLLLRLLSGTGLVFSEKGLGGPSLCKALHDLLVRVQIRCDVVSPSSKPGSQLKSLLLRVVYQLVQPTGPLAAKQGPLDAQCKLLQCMSHLDFCNADISIAMSIFECTGILVHSYISQVDRIKCVNIGERLHPTSHLFSGIFASVLGPEPHKQDRPVSWDVLLISLLKLLAKLVQTPLPSVTEQTEPMDAKPYRSAQTDESKAEQIQQERNIPPVPCLADTVLQHHPSIIRLCQSLAACKASSLSMLANISQQSTLVDLGEPGTVGDAVFHTLAALARKTSRKELIMEPLLMFLSQAPQLSEPLLWFILQVLDTEEALRGFLNAGGIGILGRSLVHSSNAPNTVSHSGTVSMVMQHFGGSTTRSDASTAIASASATKKLQQVNLENNMALINFAPFGTIKCQSSSAQPADVLIQGSAAAHRRARTAQWSYHFYPEEVHTELILQLPSAVLLREVHLQPHLGSLATCPSAVALEVSSDGPSRLVPACPPLPTSGMTFIRLHLPVPEVVNCIQLRLYKPRDASSIGLSQIRLLGTSAFGGSTKQQVLDLSEDESHCKYSLGWLRLLHHCFTLPIDVELKSQIVENATQVPDLLLVCCGLLLVPTHIPVLYLPNLERVLCELSLHNRENGLHVIEMLLESRLCIGETVDNDIGMTRSPLFLHSAGVQSACELLYQICGYQDSDTLHRIIMLLQWLKSIAHSSIRLQNTDLCNPAYVSCIASILWTANQLHDSYNLGAIIDAELFHTIYTLSTITKSNVALKHALDCLLCSLCYIKIELFSSLLQIMGVLVPNLSTAHDASISDDLKDSECMTDDTKQTFGNETEWYGRLVIGEIHELELSDDNLETIALVSRSPNAIQQLLDSGLPKKLTGAILEFCNNNSDNSIYSIQKLENVTAVLKFFADISDEKVMRDWLGSKDGSAFWLPLLQWLCKRPCTKRSNLKSEVHAQLEEICVRFLTKCCLCHSGNQALLAKILCEVISQQRNGISGFMRRLILQLLLENEKVPVSINADETIYKNSAVSYSYLPLHPAFKQTHNQALLYLGTNTILADIIEQHISFSTTVEIDNTGGSKKDVNVKNESMKGWWGMAIDSDISVAAGVTAKDKRAKDAKNLATSTPQLKKKRYTATENSSSADVIEGRIIKCAAVSDQPLPVALSLGQVLRLIENKGMKTDWPCIHLVISQSKVSEDKNMKTETNPIIYQRSFSSALQVFTSVGGLALLAQHLPAVYPETIRASPSEKSSSEQSESDWVKVEANDDIYEDVEETSGSNTPSKTSGIIPNVPTHSLTAFGLFLRLPGYAEMLLKDMKKASCLLRLVLGVTDDGEGGDIFQSSLADSLPTLPFEVLRQLYDSTPLSTDDGRLLRRISINTGVVHLILACLGIFTHQTQTGNDKEVTKDKDVKLKDERTQLYWAKGTGFGTGSTLQSWNVEQALLKQRSEEEHVTVLLQVLASYINPKGEAADELADSVLPTIFYHLLANSALLPALRSYLRNDSVLDMARHIPLYRAALQLLRALALSSQLVSLLLPQKIHNNGPSVGSLLKNMKTCVDTYASKLRFGNKSALDVKIKARLGGQLEELERDEGLAQLMPDIQATANLVKEVTDRLEDSEQDMLREAKMDYPLPSSVEQRYLSFMKHLQFDTYEMIQELPDGGYKFVISHHFENNARSAGDQSHPARVKRLAQEAVTLATSLPLSYSSSVFVRCDTDRLDIMKVLITGPADTPYANGCFELDVYFPPDYPLVPMLINLETTGHRTVRFNPNLYNDGKVCLSVLNTWHGRPEEKWNTQTSSFLQVLVSIQSLILVPEPYFNEPGYERSRGTSSGTQSSREYNQNIWQATVRWAMLEQIINPCPCFKDVIHAHFYLKRHEIISQIEDWIKDIENHFAEKQLARNNSKRSAFTNLESFKKVFDQLRDKIMQLKPPEGVEDGEVVMVNANSEVAESSTNAPIICNSEQQDIDVDVDMEKMVDDMCE